MAKNTTQVKSNLKASTKDFTIVDTHKAVIRFDKASVLEITVNSNSKSIELNLVDELENKTYTGTLTLTVKE